MPTRPRKRVKVSESRWSDGATHDGYQVRAGQVLFFRRDLLPAGVCDSICGMAEKVAGVDAEGRAISAKTGDPFDLEDWTTE